MTNFTLSAPDRAKIKRALLTAGIPTAGLSDGDLQIAYNKLTGEPLHNEPLLDNATPAPTTPPPEMQDKKPKQQEKPVKPMATPKPAQKKAKGRKAAQIIEIFQQALNEGGDDITEERVIELIEEHAERIARKIINQQLTKLLTVEE